MAQDTKRPDDSSLPEREGEIATRTRPETRKPRLYKVVLHNDDYTTQEFVVEILMHIFHKPRPEATQIMLHVHVKGIGVCGVYTHEVAETKVAEVTARARAQGMPLLCTMEPE